MPSYAIKSSGIRQVAANSLIGRQTTTGSAEELSATDAKTLLGLGTTDSPTFAGLTVDGDLTLNATANIVSDTTSFTYDLATSSGYGRIRLSSSHIALRGSGYFAWSDNADRSDSGTLDTRLYRDGSGILAQRNGTNAQSFRIYNTDDGSQTNYERGSVGWDSNVFTIGTQAAGTGTARAMQFITGGTARGGFNTSGKFQAGTKIYLHATATSNQPYISNSANYLLVASKKGLYASHFSDSTSGDVHTFTQSSSSVEMTDTDGPQSFMSITPRVGQSGTAAYNGLKIDITESSLGDGSSGDGNNAILVKVGGTSKFKVDNAGSAYVGYGTKIASSNNGRIDFSAGGVALFGLSNGAATLPTNGYFAFGSNYLNPSRVRIYSDADNQIDIRYSTNAQTLNIYNTGSGSDYERGFLKWDSSTFKIGTEAAGTGTARDLVLATGGTEAIKIAGSNQRITIPNLPTSDPASAGELWNDSGTLKVSAG